MTNRSRGAELERRAKALLEAHGFIVHRTQATPFLGQGGFRGSHANDVFGVFDLIAMRPVKTKRVDDFDDLLFVQVTVKEEMRKRERKVFPVAARAPAAHVAIEVWGFVGGLASKGGQRFRRTQWNGLEWADCKEIEAPPALARPKKKKEGANAKQRRKATRKDSTAGSGDPITAANAARFIGSASVAVRGISATIDS